MRKVYYIKDKEGYYLNLYRSHLSERVTGGYMYLTEEELVKDLKHLKKATNPFGRVKVEVYNLNKCLDIDVDEFLK